MKFKIGDRVTAIRNFNTYEGYIHIGMVGTIIDINSNICVEFDENIKGHDGLCSKKKGKPEHCWWVGKYEIQLASIETKKIVITSEGKETVAKLYEGNKLLKTAKAKCSPDDKFDFNTGARIAFDRLIGEESSPKYYNGKVVCVEKVIHSAYTVGKIYEFKDGKVIIDTGTALPLDDKRITTLDEWNNDATWYAKFIPLVD